MLDPKSCSDIHLKLWIYIKYAKFASTHQFTIHVQFGFNHVCIDYFVIRRVWVPKKKIVNQ